jgi:CheY-like chemotaxis protein
LNADGARISQVLCNLINNACKFTPAGGDIIVSARESDGDALIKVKDSGIGIPSDQLGNIFDMFSQVSDPVSDNQAGLGIGLALAKQLIEMHGGSIEAKVNADSPGSEFVVRLPSIGSAEKPSPKPSPVRRSAPSGRRILVVDDNFDSAESMATFLGVTGNNCRMAHSGQQALDMAEEFLPDVILLDIGLPGMDGYEVCRIIREQPWGEDICVIAMTGWGQPDDRQRSADAGFNAHLVKPVDITKLYELIDTVSPRKQT